jgi:flagellar protein FlbD
VVPVTRLNGSRFFVNAELIKFVEATPDTVVTLIDGNKLVVRETPQVVVQAVIEYRRQVAAGRPLQPGEAS